MKKILSKNYNSHTETSAKDYFTSQSLKHTPQHIFCDSWIIAFALTLKVTNCDSWSLSLTSMKMMGYVTDILGTEDNNMNDIPDMVTSPFERKTSYNEGNSVRFKITSKFY